MHCSAVSEDTPVSVAFRGKAHARVAYNRSVELVLAAAREYFNSSATLCDPCMTLARYDVHVPLVCFCRQLGLNQINLPEPANMTCSAYLLLRFEL